VPQWAFWWENVALSQVPPFAPPRQQPSGQEVASHVQTPARHSCPEAHAGAIEQFWPPEPQWVAQPIVHVPLVPPLQQPVGQYVTLQGSHRPLLAQICVDVPVHTLQAAPPQLAPKQ
jgi:hypothetical protein